MRMITTKNISFYCIPGLMNRKKLDLTKHRHTIEEIAEMVAKNLHIPVLQMKIQTRKREVVVARQMVGYIATKLMAITHSCHSVGRFLGVDHSTVIHGSKAIANLIETNSQFRYKSMIIFKSLDL